LNELILTGNTEYSNGKLIPNLEVILKTYIIIGSKIGKKEFNFDFFFFFFFYFFGSINNIFVPEFKHIDNSNALQVIKNKKISSENKKFVMIG